ncbi:MAG TPA: winged helix-turn-helix transcriptional regulator [Candidatus Merdisoma merdipullorum]|nr:winged helix-turn-helix transcriptional regulator [Candidatus Merdisoma merdipullorum]
MKEHHQELNSLAEEFESCRQLLLALGDENRQHLILEMMRMGQCDGVRIGAITEKTNLSRPAVSHHIQILKAAGLLKMRREGTKNYYYFDADMEAMDRLIQMLIHAKEVMERLPDRNGE